MRCRVLGGGNRARFENRFLRVKMIKLFIISLVFGALTGGMFSAVLSRHYEQGALLFTAAAIAALIFFKMEA